MRLKCTTPSARATSLVCAFFLPIFVRAAPEILMGRFIVGFDTISYYVPVVYKWINGSVGFYEIMSYAPLFYGILAWLAFVGVPLTLSLKILPPLLLGFLGLVVYAYARKVMAWPAWKCLSVSLLSTVYFVALRISWDMLRSELALIFLFSFLILLPKSEAKGFRYGFVLVAPFMVLVALTHQLVSVIMFGVLLGIVLRKLLGHERAAVRNIVLWAIPAIVVLAVVVCSGFLVSSGSLVLAGFPSRDLGGWFSLFGYDSYLGMVVDGFGFLLFCFVFLLPFAYLGFRRVRRIELETWFVFGFALALCSIVSPWGFVVSSYRWTLLLIFPLSFFAVEGLSRLSRNLWKRTLCVGMALLSLSFVVLPAEVAFPFFNLFPYYVPSSMLQNSVSMRDCEDVVNVLSWYDGHSSLGGTLLVHDAFQGWAILFLSNSSRVLCYGYGDSGYAARNLINNGSAHVYLIWWVSGEGWHGVESLPSSFVEVYRSGRMALYEFGTA